MKSMHLADLICPHCCYALGESGRHNTALEDGMTITCSFPDERAETELDKRFGAKTNAKLAALNMYVSDLGRRLSVAQHSQLMTRLENVVLAAMDEGRAAELPTEERSK